MFEKVSDVLEAFVAAEIDSLKDVDMPHMPTLGSAYEAITKEGVNQDYVIPKGLGLKVVSGFITVADVMLPQQIDAMLVVGDGKRYGKTEQFIYEIAQVLCIFEIKKTLRKNDLKDAFLHLRELKKAFTEDFSRKIDDEGFQPNVFLAGHHFSQITGRKAPGSYNDLKRFDVKDQILMYTLIQEIYAPATIIQGYGGYETEYGLRTAFIDSLEELYAEYGNGAGLGVPGLPSLITSNNFSLVKGCGLPFIMTNQEREWVVIGSTRFKSIRMMMELIWSKISIFCDSQLPWGDGVSMENVSPLMLAIPAEHNGQIGWRYPTIEYKEKTLERAEHIEWEPNAITNNEYDMFIQLMCDGGMLKINEDLCEVLDCTIDEAKEMASNLTKTMEFVLDGDLLEPIKKVIFVIKNDTDGAYLSSNRERFDAWCHKKGIEPGYITLIVTW